ncbi:AfsR/SARP family transcriptional regulator, partial [Crossiella equi]
MRAETEFRVLGPLEVRVGAAAVPIGAAKQRVVLATLLLHANEPVSVEELIGNLWDRQPPARPKASLHTYVTRLRQSLGEGARLRAAGHGYLLDVEPERVDLFRFRRLVRRAEQVRAGGDVEAESMLLAEATGLVRGPVLGDVPSEALHRTDVALLTEAQLAVLERRIEVELELGRHHEVIGRLVALAVEHPLRERFAELLVLARYRAGQQAEALAAYRAAARALREELGASPGPGLRELHEAVLRGDPGLRAPSPRAPVRPGRVPAELPAVVGDFVGREADLAELAGRLAPGQVVVLSGPPGVGKTALAVAVGHRLRAGFPDGQLHANLRGYSPEPAAGVGQVLSRFLRALGVPREEVPSAVDEQAALYRRLLAGRRVFVLLDNAAEPGQLGPLLPVEPGCAVLVTSRRDAPPVIEGRAVHRRQLGSFTEAECTALLVRLLGADVVAAAPEAAGGLAQVCARLPLALRVAAANLAARPRPDLAAYTEQLARGNRLAALAIEGDGATAVRSAFDSSYTALDPAARTVFRRSALVPGGDFSAEAATALFGQDATSALDTLVTMSLLTRPAPGRYACHDLIRLYARDRAEEEEPPATRAAALGGLFDHYFATSRAAVELLTPDVALAVAPGLPPVPPFPDRPAAAAWLDHEIPNLVAAIRAHPGLGLPLVRLLGGYVYFRQERTVWIEATTAALAAAREVGDLPVVAAMLDSLGTALWGAGEFEQGLRHHREAAEILDRIGGDPGLAESALLHLGIVHMEMGRLAAAAQCYQRVLDTYRPEGPNRAKVLLNLGSTHVYGGDITTGVAHAEQALAICREHGIAFGEALCLGNLSVAHRMLGDPARAAELARRSREIYRGLGKEDADSVDVLAAALLAGGDAETALPLAEQACALARARHFRRAEADAYNTRGACCAALGRPHEAERHHTEALRVATLAGYLLGEINALIGQAVAYQALGRAEQARNRLHAAAAAANRGGFQHELARVRALL